MLRKGAKCIYTGKNPDILNDNRYNNGQILTVLEKHNQHAQIINNNFKFPELSWASIPIKDLTQVK